MLLHFCVEFGKAWDFLVGIFHEACGYSLLVTLTGGALSCTAANFKNNPS